MRAFFDPFSATYYKTCSSCTTTYKSETAIKLKIFFSSCKARVDELQDRCKKCCHRTAQSYRGHRYVKKEDQDKMLTPELAIRKMIEMTGNPEVKRPFKGYISNLFITASKNPDVKNVLKTLRPDWFETVRTRAQDNKERYLQRALAGEVRPAYVEARDLFNFLNPKSKSYDADFAKKIEKVNSSWLVKPRT